MIKSMFNINNVGRNKNIKVSDEMINKLTTRLLSEAKEDGRAKNKLIDEIVDKVIDIDTWLLDKNTRLSEELYERLSNKEYNLIEVGLKINIKEIEGYVDMVRDRLNMMFYSIDKLEELRDRIEEIRFHIKWEINAQHVNFKGYGWDGFNIID